MPNDPSVTRRYLAIYLPLLSAERLVRERIRQGGKAPDGPFVLAEKERGSMRVAACDERAFSLGLKPGLALADARARVPSLAVFEHDPDADRVLLEWLGEGCERYTPLVEVRPPQGFLLDISGCEHIWDGETGLKSDLSQRLIRAGFSCIVAAAETPDKAWALACHGDQDSLESNDVHKLPIRALELDDNGLRALSHAGLRTIGDLACRPRIPLAARLGLPAVLQLDRLLGYDDARISPRRLAPALFAVQRFAEPVLQNTQILAALEQLLVQSSIALYERAEGGRRFAVTFYRSDGDVRSLAVETGAPTRDPKLLLRLFRERIDMLADPLDPGFGYDALRLDVLRTAPLAPRQKEALDENAQVADEFGSLIDQLTTRLGSGHVLRFIAGDSHIPELASLCVSAQQAGIAFPWPIAEAGEPPLRPCTLFDPPHPIEVMIAEMPDGPPAAFRWRKAMYKVAYAEGPERIAGQWWRRKYGYLLDSRHAARDYFRIEDDKGRRFWLFRSGFYGHARNPLWYLHGAFA